MRRPAGPPGGDGSGDEEHGHAGGEGVVKREVSAALRQRPPSPDVGDDAVGWRRAPAEAASEELGRARTFAAAAHASADVQRELARRLHPTAHASWPAVASADDKDDPGLVVLGGTDYLVEARVRGLEAMGVDLNPLAVRLSRLKSNPLDEKRRQHLAGLASELREVSEERVRAREDVRADLPPTEKLVRDLIENGAASAPRGGSAPAPSSAPRAPTSQASVTTGSAQRAPQPQMAEAQSAPTLRNLEDIVALAMANHAPILRVQIENNMHLVRLEQSDTAGLLEFRPNAAAPRSHTHAHSIATHAEVTTTARHGWLRRHCRTVP
jgi:hypothetical protein